MSQDFDEFPLYDPLVKGDKISDKWRDFMATFYMSLIGYLSSGGIFLPQLTTNQRDDLQNVINGQMIYNTTLNTAQYFKAGTWASF